MVTDTKESFKKYLDAAFGSDSSSPVLDFSYIANINNGARNSRDTSSMSNLQIPSTVPASTTPNSEDSSSFTKAPGVTTHNPLVTDNNFELKRSSTDSVTSTQTTDSASSTNTNDTDNTLTPDLTPDSSIGTHATGTSVETVLKRRSVIASDDDLLDPGIQDAQNTNELLIETEATDVSHLFWVPAHLHPEIAPNEFRKWLQNHAKDGFNTGPSSLRRRKSALSRQYIPPENENENENENGNGNENENEEEEEEEEEKETHQTKETSKKKVDVFDWESFGSSCESITPASESTKLNILRRSLSLNLPPYESSMGPMDPLAFDRNPSQDFDSHVLIHRTTPALKRAARTHRSKNRRNSVDGEHNPRRFSAHRRTKSTHFVPEKNINAQLKSGFQNGQGNASQDELSNDQPSSSFDLKENNGNDDQNKEKDIELARISLKDSKELIRITLQDHGAEDKPSSNSSRTSSLPKNRDESMETSKAEPLAVIVHKSSLNFGMLSKKISPGKLHPSSSIQPGPPQGTIIKRSSTWSSWLPWGNSEDKEPRIKKSKSTKESKSDRESKGEKETKLEKKAKNDKEDESTDQEPKTDDVEHKTEDIENTEIAVVKEKPKISFGSIFSWNSRNKTDSSENNTSAASTSTSVAFNKKPKYTNYNRFPIHVERAIYRLSHMKLANPRRPLHEQVLISNMMFWYLSLISKQQEEYGGRRNSNVQKEAMKVKSKVMKGGGRGKRGKGNKNRGGGTRRGPGPQAEVAYKAPQYDMQQAQIAQQYLTPSASSSHSGSTNSHGSSSHPLGYSEDDYKSDEEFHGHSYHHYNDGYTSDGTNPGYLHGETMNMDDDGAGVAANKGEIPGRREGTNTNLGSIAVNTGFKRPPSPNALSSSPPTIGQSLPPNGRSNRPKSPDGRSVSPNREPNPSSQEATPMRHSLPPPTTPRLSGAGQRTRSVSAGPRIVVNGSSSEVPSVISHAEDEDEDDDVPLALYKNAHLAVTTGK